MDDRIDQRLIVVLLIAFAAFAVQIGCDKSKFELSPVRGKVTIADQPLERGKVVFAPIASGDTAAAGKAAVGLTSSDGSFTLTTYSDQDGAVVGEHWVTIFAPEAAKNAAGEIKYKRIAVPQKKVVAADQENVIDIAL